jgi:hypothetical protein
MLILYYSQLSEISRPRFDRILHHKKKIKTHTKWVALQKEFFSPSFLCIIKLMSPHFGCTESETNDASNNFIFISKDEGWPG